MPVQVAGEADIWRGNTPVRSPSVLWDLNGGVTTLPLDDFGYALTFEPIFALENNG